MDLIKDLRTLRKEKDKEISVKAQLRKRSKESIANDPTKGKEKSFSNDPRMQGI